MLQNLLDTDHLTLYDFGHPLVRHRLARYPPGAVGTSVVTMEESLRGRLAALARATNGPTRVACYGLLSRTVRLFHRLPTVPFDHAEEGEFQRLRSLRLNVGAQDLKIAAVALPR